MTTPMRHTDVDAQVNAISGAILDAAIEVHRHLGPGLLESLYEDALAWELTKRGHMVRRQVPIPIVYKDQVLGGGLRIDMIVDDRVLVELKAVEALAPVHFAQVDRYVHLSMMQLGILINFHVALLKDGYHRRRPRQDALRAPSDPPGSAVSLPEDPPV